MNKKRTFFLGAGASVEAGVPITRSMTKRILSADYNQFAFHDFIQPGQLSFMRIFLKNLIDNEASWTSSVGLDPHNIEELLVFAEMAEQLEVGLPYPISDPECDLETMVKRLVGTSWSVELASNVKKIEEEVTSNAKRIATNGVSARWVADNLVWLMLDMVSRRGGSELPDQYCTFARLINTNDSMVTVNYDTIAEEVVFSHLGQIDYCLDSDSCKVRSADWIVDQGVHILKLHGSCNWRQCVCQPDRHNENCGKLFVYRSGGPAHGYSVSRVCECGDGNLRTVVVPPVPGKSPSHDVLRQIWIQALEDIVDSAELYFVGYSFPQYDVDIRQLIRIASAKNPNVRIRVVNPDPGTFDNYEFLKGMHVEFIETEFSSFVASF